MLNDPRVVKQAKILVNYSTKVKKGDVVQINGSELAKPLLLEIFREVIKKQPKEVITHIGIDELMEIFYEECTEEQLKQFPEIAMHETKNTDVWISIIAPSNTRGLSLTSPNKVALRQKTILPILEHRVEHTRWVLSAFPTQALAQEADMPLSSFADFVFSTIVDVDWKKLAARQNQLSNSIELGKEVHIQGEDTDLTLSIAGRKVVPDNGECNMPGGEVFTSVVENSANGYIHFTYPAIYHSREVENVKLWFKQGKVIKAEAKKGEEFLHKMIAMDKGSKFIGELGIGNNFHINRFSKNILFDEKIGGTIHLALGRSYSETRGKNISALHWDMIKDLRRGGSIKLDGKVIQKDGEWLV